MRTERSAAIGRSIAIGAPARGAGGRRSGAASRGATPTRVEAAGISGRPFFAAVLAAAAALAAVSCRDAGAPPSLEVLYSGCEVVLAGPVCALGEERRVLLWAGTDPAAEVLVDGAPPAVAVAVAGGLRFEVEPGEGSTRLVVEARRGGLSATWTLPLAGGGRPAWQREAWELARRGEVEAARRLAEARLSSAEPADRGQALAVLARLDLRDDPERGVRRLAEAVRAHRAAGNLSDAVRDTAPIVHRLLHERRFPAARELLDALPEPPGDADIAYHLAVNRALLASFTGDVRSALAELAPTVGQAERLGRRRQRLHAEQVLGAQLLKVGRFAEAEALFARLHGAGDGELSACDRAQVANNRAWGRLLAREAGSTAPDPLPLLEEALALLEEECLDLPDERVNVRVNMALAHLQGDRPDLAGRYLAEARRLDPAPPLHVLLWWRDLEARIRLGAGDRAGALAAYDRLARDARETAAPDAAWRAAFGRGRALAAAGDLAGALAAHGEAEALLDEEVLLVPMHEGRSAFVAQREEATRVYADLLLAAGRDGEALAVVRRARTRVLRSLRRSALLAALPPADRRRWDAVVAAHEKHREEVDRAAAEHWRLPGGALARALAERVERLHALRGEVDRLLAAMAARGGAAGGDAALPPLAPGDLLLVYHPLPEGWVGFAATEGRVRAVRLGDPTGDLERPAALAARLLAPFADEIAGARRVRLLPYGPLHAVDFHTLPLGDGPLLARAAVVYAADLPAPAPPPERVGGEAARALVVADPQGNLPGARREAEQVARALASRRPAWQVEVLAGGEAASPLLRRRLPGSALFHYAGHARFAGWDSALPLAAGGGLTLDDVLVLPGAPEQVVLSGCETGRHLGEPGVETIGLAHAFLAAGAGSVIAAVRPVPDADAWRLSAALHRALTGGAPPEEALRRAQIELRAADPGSAWAAFRAFAP